MVLRLLKEMGSKVRKDFPHSYPSCGTSSFFSLQRTSTRGHTPGMTEVRPLLACLLSPLRAFSFGTREWDSPQTLLGYGGVTV